MRTRLSLVFLSLVLVQTLTLQADVEVKNKSQMKFSGMAGKMFGLFGGKAAKEGLVTTEAVVGNRKLSRTEDTGEIVDLDEEKVYQVDWKKKRYQVVTFEEMREQMRKAAEQMKSMSGESQAAEEEEAGEAPEWEVDVKMEETGNTRQINGFDTREVVVTIVSRQKGKTLEEGGGMVMTSNVWLTEKVSGAGELIEFSRKYAEKLYGTAEASPDQQIAAMAALYPGMQNLIGKFRDEQVNMNGTPVLTTMTVESVASKEEAEKMKDQESEQEAPTSLGGMFGGLSKKFGKKDKAEAKNEEKTPGRSTVMTLTSELLSVSTSISADSVAIPAGFKEK